MIPLELSDKELLQFAIDSGMIDTNTIRKQIEMNERKKFIDMHEYEKWQGKNGLWYTYLPDDTKGRKLVKRKDLKSLEDAVIKFYKSEKSSEEKKNITLKEIFPMWVRFKQKHTNSTSYIKRITSDYNKFYLSEKDFINMPLKDMKPVFLDEWAHDMIKRYDMTKKMYYNMSIILRQCLDFAVDKEYISENPFSKVKINTKLFRRVKKKSGETEVYTEEEEKKLVLDMLRRFNNDTTNTAPLAVILLFETGLRIGELCALKFEDIDENNHYIHIQRQEIRDFIQVDEYNMKFNGFKIAEYTKSDDGFRDVYLTETARQIINAVKKINFINGEMNNSFIFIRNKKNINHYSVQAMIKRGCEKIGINVKTSHKIRKTYISTLIDSGLNIDQIRRMAGHSDERTTYGNYCFNRLTEEQTEEKIENALKVIKGNQILITCLNEKTL